MRQKTEKPEKGWTKKSKIVSALHKPLRISIEYHATRVSLQQWLNKPGKRNRQGKRKLQKNADSERKCKRFDVMRVLVGLGSTF